MTTLSTTRPVHFLLVEDDEAHAELVRMALEDNHVANTIDHVTDGEAALFHLRNEPPYTNARRPDIILLDLKLPKLNGHEVLERIKDDESLATIPVVMLTTSDSESDRFKAYREHVNSYVVKPVDFGKFQDMIRELKLYWTVYNRPPQNEPEADNPII